MDQMFSSRLSLPQIPSLNDTPSHHLPTSTLVRFRGMVQDMHDPEFYLGVYEVEDTKSGKLCLRSGKYKDLVHCGVSTKRANYGM